MLQQNSLVADLELVRGVLLHNTLATVQIEYYPPASRLLQELTVDIEDVFPWMPRVLRYLRHWEQCIEGKAQTITIDARALERPIVLRRKPTLVLPSTFYLM